MLPKFGRTVPRSNRPSASFEDLLRITDGVAGRTSAGDEAEVCEVIVRGVAAVADAGPEHVTWVKGQRHARAITMSRAGVVIVPEGFSATSIPAIVVKDVEAAIVVVLAYFEPARERPNPGVHPSAVIADDATIDPTAAIGAHARIGQNVRIGERTAVHGGAHLAAGASVGRVHLPELIALPEQ
jgi:UDP-3-O-[3-hydroxymyristoyl] glucosamine N-acyltransferase